MEFSSFKCKWYLRKLINWWTLVISCSTYSKMSVRNSLFLLKSLGFIVFMYIGFKNYICIWHFNLDLEKLVFWWYMSRLIRLLLYKNHNFRLKILKPFKFYVTCKTLIQYSIFAYYKSVTIMYISYT